MGKHVKRTRTPAQTLGAALTAASDQADADYAAKLQEFLDASPYTHPSMPRFERLDTDSLPSLPAASAVNPPAAPLRPYPVGPDDIADDELDAAVERLRDELAAGATVVPAKRPRRVIDVRFL